MFWNERQLNGSIWRIVLATHHTMSRLYHGAASHSRTTITDVWCDFVSEVTTWAVWKQSQDSKSFPCWEPWCCQVRVITFVSQWAISRSSQCFTTGVTKAVVCVILSVGWCKEPLLLIEKSSPCGGGGFPLYLSGPLHHVTINKMCWVHR